MKKVIIIGGGIAGLTAGVYAAQSGFDVTIYEQHTIPGGASTSWRRKGYLFEGGMHWLTGSSSEKAINKVWREVGALNDAVPIYNRDPFFIYEYNGQRACIYRDINRLQEHFLQIAPQDRQEILELCKDLRKFGKLDMPVTDLKGVKVKKKASMSISGMASMLPAIPRISFYAKQSCREYAGRFQSPLLRMLLENMIGADHSAVGLLFTIATFTSGDGGYPEGGSLAMANRMAKYFEALGGKIKYSTKVDKIEVKDGCACGVSVGGKLIQAEAVIVTLDTLVAIDKLFDSPINEDWAVQMRKNTIPILNTFICVGVEAELSNYPENITYKLKEPIRCGKDQIFQIEVNNYAGYKGYAPDGCTAITAAIGNDSYNFWKACKENGTYEAEKQKLAEDFIKLLAEKYPETTGKIAVWDVATPLTYERYLGSYKGSWMTVMKKGGMQKSYPSKPEGIKKVYFAGQRLTAPGGLPIAAETGRKAVQYLCRDTDVTFQGNL